MKEIVLGLGLATLMIFGTGSGEWEGNLDRVIEDEEGRKWAVVEVVRDGEVVTFLDVEVTGTGVE